ncbi:MAG: YbaN family protein [Lentisphaeria bacterium]|nr:YbaN family protein [Lentisphaeria bacterium]
MHAQRVKRHLLVMAGVIALGLGVAGVVVPLLPTTPFLLLAAACFMRGSDRLYHWLTRNRWLGGYIRNYRTRHGMTPRAKVAALALLWIVMGYSILQVARAWWLKGLLCAVAVGVTVHVLRLKTLPPDTGRTLSDGEC